MQPASKYASQQIVQSRQNARVKELRAALHSTGLTPGGLLAIEGPNLVREALLSGLQPHTVFVGVSATGGSNPVQILSALLGDALPLQSLPLLAIERGVLDSALSTQSPQPVAALVELPGSTWNTVLPPAGPPPLLLVTEAVQDPGNLGTALRSAEALGATGAILLPGSASPWNPKTMRAASGSTLRLPLLQAETERTLAMLKQAAITTYAAVATSGSAPAQAHLRGPSAIFLGNEGAGLSPALRALLDYPITIPCPGPVESLNAAVAASILFYEASRQRQEPRS